MFIVRLFVMFVATHAAYSTVSTVMQKRESVPIDGINKSLDDEIPIEATTNYIDDIIEQTFQSENGNIDIDDIDLTNDTRVSTKS